VRWSGRRTRCTPTATGFCSAQSFTRASRGARVSVIGTASGPDSVRPCASSATAATPSHPTYPENTLAAVRTALQAGVDGVEVDVRATEDGVLVLAHDGDLGRVLGTGAGTGPASVCVPAVGEPAPSGRGSDRGWDGWSSFSADAWSVAR
jgi:hypothetical protein